MSLPLSVLSQSGPPKSVGGGGVGGRIPHFDWSIYQRQKQSLSYASPLVVYWDPYIINIGAFKFKMKVCHDASVTFVQAKR